MILNYDIIQFNKFADLHDGNNILFYKLDYILDAFNHISNLKNNVTLVTGNSDFCVFYKNNSFIIKDLNNNILTIFKSDKIPTNLKYWFTVNNCTNIEFIKSLPMGIENDFFCKINGHGFGWEHAKKKKEILSKVSNNKSLNKINKNIYLNVNVSTNSKVRQPLKDFCLTNNIYVEKETLDYESYVYKCQEFKAVICPIGNGFDTHRFYEVLLMNRIPIIFKTENYKIYKEIYELMPCLILNEYEDLLKKETILKIENLLTLNLLEYDFKFWKKHVLSHLS